MPNTRTARADEPTVTQISMANDPSVRQRGVGPTVTVAHLHRFKLLRIGPVADRALPPGAWRPLTRAEVRGLYEATGVATAPE